MSGSIFADNAPKFWEAGRRVIPLDAASKKPSSQGWQGGVAAVPNESTQKTWLERYLDNNIGMVLCEEFSPGQILAALDVDGPRLLEPVLRFLSFNRDARRAIISGKKGKKGGTIFVRADKEKGSRSTTLKGAGELGNIDYLARGRQTVMPPSVHPDTGRPYEYFGKPFLEVSLEELPYVSPSELNALGVALGSEEILAVMDGEGTHDAGVSLVARLVAKGATDDEITAIITAFLPEGYSGNTIEELPGWIESAREKGFDSGAGKAPQSLTAKLVQLAQDEGCEFFHDRYGTTFVTVPTEEGTESYLVNSTNFKRWLRHRAYCVLNKSAGRNPLSEAVDTLDSIAAYSSDTKTVFLRVGGDVDRVEIDLGRADGHVTAITKEGWSIEPVSQHKLVRGEGFESLPNPTRGGTFAKLQTLLGLEDDAFRLVLAFLLNALKPDGPYFVLLIEGEQGSGKSFLTHVIKRIIDPNQAKGIRLPDKEKDLMIQAKAFRLLNFDNASGIKRDISDALCSLATGGGIAVRKLYTDSELNIVSYARPFIINGISNFVSMTDLMERAIPLRLPPMPAGARKEEAVLLEEFEAMLPEMLGVLYDGVARAMRDRNNVVPPTSLRMADAARWILAGETAFEFGNRSAIDAIVEAQTDLFLERVNDDPLVMRMRETTLLGRTMEGTVGELFALLDCQGNPMLPKSPSQLSKTLTRLKPAMSLAGIKVEDLGKTNKGKRFRITIEAKGPPPLTKF